jgi:hypothetical protein
MALLHTFATLLFIGPLFQVQPVARRVECREWRECRQLALDAHDSGDYERFHDLAWKTVQTGPPHDPDLMYLLARAQSLSGRPHDALIMLGRLAEMGVATDAAANDEFRVVRTLPDWPRVEALIAAVGRPPLAASPAVPASSPPAPAGAVSPAPRAVSPAIPLFTAEDAVRVPAAQLHATGLSYDRVSGRFVVADRSARKLVIIDERSRHVVDLVGAESAGFHEIRALEIDGRRGQLWVVSAAEAGTDNQPTSVLHKVQLVSGRPLAALPLPGLFGAARFDDVAVSETGTVFVLDGLGGRLFRLGPDQRSFVVAASLGLGHPTSLAPVDDRIVYVAHAEGVAAQPRGRSTDRIRTYSVGSRCLAGHPAAAGWHPPCRLGPARERRRTCPRHQCDRIRCIHDRPDGGDTVGARLLLRDTRNSRQWRRTRDHRTAGATALAGCALIRWPFFRDRGAEPGLTGSW